MCVCLRIKWLWFWVPLHSKFQYVKFNMSFFSKSLRSFKIKKIVNYIRYQLFEFKKFSIQKQWNHLPSIFWKIYFRFTLIFSKNVLATISKYCTIFIDISGRIHLNKLENSTIFFHAFFFNFCPKQTFFILLSPLWVLYHDISRTLNRILPLIWPSY